MEPHVDQWEPLLPQKVEKNIYLYEALKFYMSSGSHKLPKIENFEIGIN
jgi:hypothetical protein